MKNSISRKIFLFSVLLASFLSSEGKIVTSGGKVGKIKALALTPAEQENINKLSSTSPFVKLLAEDAKAVFDYNKVIEENTTLMKKLQDKISKKDASKLIENAVDNALFQDGKGMKSAIGTESKVFKALETEGILKLKKSWF